MITARSMLLLALLLVFCIPALCADLPKVAEDDYWMGVYYKDTRIGYMHTVVKQDTFEGKPVIAKRDDMVLRLRSGAGPCDIKVAHTLYVGEDYQPLADIVKLADPLKEDDYDIEMRYTVDSVNVTASRKDAEPSTMLLPMEEGDYQELVAGAKYCLGVSGFKVGDKYKASFYGLDNLVLNEDGLSLDSTNCDLEVLREETVPHSRKPVKSLVVKQTQKNDVSTAWRLASGQTYKVEHKQRSLTFIWEPMEEATDVPEGAGPNVDKQAKEKPKADDSEHKASNVQAKDDLSNVEQDYWMGVYHGDTQVGYVHVVVKKDTYEGKPVLYKLEDMKLRYRTAERFYQQETKQKLYAGEDFLPLAQSISVVDAPGSEPREVLALRCNGETLDMNMFNDQSQPVKGSTELNKETIDLYTAAAIYDLGLAKLKVGDKFGAYYWGMSMPDLTDPDARLEWHSTEPKIEVLREETLEDGTRALVVKEKRENSVLTKWFDESGGIHKQRDDRSDLTFIREPMEKVLEIEKGYPPVVGKPARTASKDYWMGVYYGDTKIGYLHTTMGPGKYQGEDVLQRQDDLKLRYVSKGVPTRLELIHNLYADGFHTPIKETVRASSSESSRYDFYMELDYNGNGATGWIGPDEQTARRVDLPFAEGGAERTIAGTLYSFAPDKLEVGRTYQVKHFILHGMCIKDSRVNMAFDVGECKLEGLRKEKLKVGDTEYDTLVVSESYQGDMITRYILDSGEEVRQMDRANNIFFHREPKEKATEIDKGDGPDIDKLQ